MKNRLLFIFEVVFLVFVFFLANIRSFIFWGLFPETDSIFKEAWREVLIWLMVLFTMFYLLQQRGAFRKYLLSWLKEPLLITFILFSLASILWSDNWTVTLHRSLVFTFASLAAVFLGVRYSLDDFLKVLSWMGGPILLASLFMVLFNPDMGRYANFYDGAWRGIFWHKNQLGNILPIFNLVYLVRFFSLKNGKALIEKIVLVVLYSFSLIEIFLAKSVSGYILVILLHFAFGVSWLWLYLRHHLKPIHYFVFLGVSILAVIVIFFNLDFVLGLFNRTPTFTGRIPMWTILLRDVFPQHPWFGHGFGTIWADEAFRVKMQALTKWGFPLVIGDNGFLDILLNLGAVGFFLFLLNYLKAWVSSARYFLMELSLEGFFPLIFMVYTFFANLTFSLLMETEVFVWMLIITLMVIMAQKKNGFPIAQQGIHES